MKRFVNNFIRICLAVSAITSASARDKTSDNEKDMIFLTGSVKTAVTKAHLPEAVVILPSREGNTTDTIRTYQKRYTYSRITGQDAQEISFFIIPVERRDTTVVFDVECPGFQPKTVAYALDHIKKGEQTRELPPIYMERAPRQLGELTVTASKVKFYNRGDTIVYNADAFQLAEGSMLDALISQLPGVELNNEGQIKVNGEFVESLLLDGKKFFDGDNNLMLQNIAAYTVKNVKVFQGQTREEKWIGDTLQPKHLTMDVRLRKEFNRGLVINAQGGYGTRNRYLGKLFASMFSPTTRLTLVGNLNNLNDNRNPGKDDSWTPEMMPSGTREFRNGAFDYNYTSPDERQNANGYLKVEYNAADNRSTTSRTNFLSGGDTYDYAFSRSRDSRLTAETRNHYNYLGTQFGFWNMLLGRYIRRTSDSDNLSATFNEEQADITRRAIETLYTESSAERIDAVINRSLTKSDGSSHEGEVQYFPDFNYKIPGTPSRLHMQLGVRYKENKEERWRDYNINYGADPEPAVRRRQYIDNSPNNRLTLEGTVGFNTRIGRAGFGVGYSYSFVDENKDSYMYALERLEDMGVYGTVPAGYLDTFDPDNSYTSRLRQQQHDLFVQFNWNKTWNNGNSLYVGLRPEVSLLLQHLDYWRGGRRYLLDSESFLAKVGRSDFNIMFHGGRQEQSGNKTTYTHILTLNLTVDTKTPDPTHRIDIVNDSDPLNIALGNPGLKNAYVFTPSFSWSFRPKGAHLNNSLNLSARFADNDLVRGYTYERATGIRLNRTYNVGGNQSQRAADVLSWAFGRKEQFTLSYTAEYMRNRYANMIGVDVSEPVKSVVTSVRWAQILKFDWTFGKQTVGVKGVFGNRHTTSSLEGFNVINARNYSAGLTGVFSIPRGFGVSTDFSLYARRGYGVKELDTNDLVWNMRVSYTPPNSLMSFYIDAFDMLHQLSNVSYAVNDQARTITYTNALPRYLLFTVQFRLFRAPKKK